MGGGHAMQYTDHISEKYIPETDMINQCQPNKF